MRMGFKNPEEFLKDKSIAGFPYKEYEIAMGMRDESPTKLRFTVPPVPPVPYGSVFNSAIVSGMISAILR
jgi:hypothetical protein